MKIDMKGFVTKTYIDTPFGRKGPKTANVTFQLTGDLGSYNDLEATMNDLITAGELDISITKEIDWAEKYKEAVKEFEHPDCNCLEMARGQLGKYPTMILDPWWVCPKHGYKRR